MTVPVAVEVVPVFGGCVAPPKVATSVARPNLLVKHPKAGLTLPHPNPRGHDGQEEREAKAKAKTQIDFGERLAALRKEKV